MKLTTRSEYALLALAHLARDRSGKFVSVEAIAAAQRIPRKYLEHLLLVLKRSGFVRSAKGHGGGYRLAKPAGTISLAEIIRLMDGALAGTPSVSRYFYERTPIMRERRLVRVFKEIRDIVAAKLERTMLGDVV